MSQSPTKESTSDEVRKYDVGWSATNKMIRQGKSFSGRERNCAFLNLGDGARFATVSGAAGLDFIDDGRGLALCDWDYDGRTDFWVTNRTGPRLRFIHNRYPSGNGFVALRLLGTKSNPDGIGARVTVELSSGKPMAKTLAAGSGYLSQSTKWLNFGVPRGARVASVSVRWPGGETESFSGVSAGGFYRLTEGGGEAVSWKPPRYAAGLLDVKPTPSSDDGGPARVLPMRRPPMPTSLSFTTSAGSEVKLNSLKGAPVVLQLWATWCPNCETEMAAWKAAAAAISATGAIVVPLCADEPSDDRAADLAKAKRVALERGYPWPVGLANASLIDHLNIIQKSYIGRQEDLPLPSAFLIDAVGELVAIYKGAVSPETLAADLSIAEGGESRDQIAARALPYSGKWMEQPPGTMPRGIAIALVENGFNREAEAYLQQILPSYVDAAAGEDDEARDSRERELNECYTFLGALAYDDGDKVGAIGHYQKALALFPKGRKMRYELMRCYVDLRQPAKAAEQVEALLEDRPDDFENLAQLASLRKETGEFDLAVELYGRSLAVRDHPETRNALANLLRDLGRCEEAVVNYRAALEARPGWPLPANNAAWILATHPDDAIRNGAEAVRFAEVAAGVTKRGIAAILSTLAAAQAEAGDFDGATKTLTEAIALAEARGDEGMAGRLQARLAQFAKRQPTRDPNLLPDAK